MTVFFIEGLLLGLTSGISCLFLCMPVLFGLGSRDINNIQVLKNISFLLTGRFISYIFVGLVFSAIGVSVSFLAKFEFIFKIIIGILMIIWGTRGFGETEALSKKNCTAKKFGKTVPFIAGIMTGLSPCPPFIAGISRVITIADIAGGILYFTGFFFSTTIFLLPVFFTGLIKYKFGFKIISSVISFIFGIIFLINGLYSLWTLYAV